MGERVVALEMVIEDEEVKRKGRIIDLGETVEE